MPIMIRPKSKSTKIAFNILGVPGAIQDKKTAKQKEIDRRLLRDNTARVR